MRIVARFVGGVAVVLLLAAAVLFLLRKPVVEAAAERLLAGTGLLSPAVSVRDASLSSFAFASVKAGRDPAAPDLSIDGVVVEFDLGRLVFGGKVKSIAVDGGAAVIAVDGKGAISIAGWSPDPAARPAPPPFSRLSIRNFSAIARTPQGDARIGVEGDFDYAAGGQFRLGVEAERAGFQDAVIAGGVGEVALRLGADGSIAAEGGVKSAVETSLGIARDVDLEIAATLSSWRGLFGEGPRALNGDAQLTLRSSRVAMTETPSLSPLAAAAGAPIETLALSGVLNAAFAADGMVVTLGDGPFRIASDRGDFLELASGEGPLFERRGGARRLSLKAAFGGLLATGAADLAAASENGGPWRVDAAARLGRQTVAGVSIDSFAGAFRGDYAARRLEGEADILAHVSDARIGRMQITDMPAAGKFAVVADMTEKSLRAGPAGGACVAIERAGLRMAEQDMDARVGDVLLCPSAGPMIAMRWDEDASVRIAGAMTAKKAHYRLGRTIFDGAPPNIDFALDYEPASRTSRLSGDIAGGRVLLNNALILTGASGRFDVDIVGDDMSAKAALLSMKIAQNAKLEMVAPVAVAGDATLADNIARFDFKVMTPAGAPLGEGQGKHQVKTGKGEAVFDSGVLTFARGLQPDRLIPALKGVISAASGAAEGRALFQWTPAEMRSSATVNLDDVSFGGPGVAVTRTEGVSGKMVFSSLSPVATGGEQTISIRRIDLDALKLENGVMRFALPGDDTLRIVEAEFPWFGGTIGAYDSQMSIAGGESKTTLQIDNVDLADLLGYIKVEGLSGDGTIEGVLPISFEGGKARVANGILSSKGAGVIRYQGKAADAASQSNEQSALAFEILRELRFEKLAATIDGPLDGTLNFNILFDGRSDIPVKTGDTTQRVDSPVKYRVTISAPLLSLVEQAILSTDVKLQLERAQAEQDRSQ